MHKYTTMMINDKHPVSGHIVPWAEQAAGSSNDRATVTASDSDSVRRPSNRVILFNLASDSIKSIDCTQPLLQNLSSNPIVVELMPLTAKLNRMCKSETKNKSVLQDMFFQKIVIREGRVKWAPRPKSTPSVTVFLVCNAVKTTVVYL